jgi:hypothetical protein
MIPWANSQLLNDSFKKSSFRSILFLLNSVFSKNATPILDSRNHGSKVTFTEVSPEMTRSIPF